ncbi:MAG: 5'/3'-nucleotidase SurE [Bacteroidales bacterium]|nr:5'/3'-nucleotidase SurE [Bacteroidales bacterium]
MILITNDDAIDAPGLDVLVRVAAEFGDVIAVAPVLPQSGKSSAITVDGPLRINQLADRHGARRFTVSGTPVDCVKLALDAIVPRRPDLLLSGINHGSNSGNAITYSGTMGAVLEGCTVGIPSVGFSLCHHSIRADFGLSERCVREIIGKVMQTGMPDYTCLNVNIPARIVPKGIKVCRAARGHWTQEYARMTDPHGVPCYWLTGRFVNEEPQADDTDEYWLDKGYVSVVPCTPDQTNRDFIEPFGAILDVDRDNGED